MYPYQQYPGQGNPANDFYFRNAQQQFQPPAPQWQQPQITARFVSCVDEAKAVIADPLSTYIFIDRGCGKIYMKRLSDSGLSEFYVYAPEAQGAGHDRDPMEEISARLANIEKYLGGLKNESVPGNEFYEKPAGGRAAADAPADGEGEPADVPQSHANDKWKKR